MNTHVRILHTNTSIYNATIWKIDFTDDET